MPICNGLKLSLLGSYQIEKAYSFVSGDLETSTESVRFSPLKLDFAMGLGGVTFSTSLISLKEHAIDPPTAPLQPHSFWHGMSSRNHYFSTRIHPPVLGVFTTLLCGAIVAFVVPQILMGRHFLKWLLRYPYMDFWHLV
jgi:hypothetical protein